MPRRRTRSCANSASNRGGVLAVAGLLACVVTGAAAGEVAAAWPVGHVVGWGAGGLLAQKSQPAAQKSQPKGGEAKKGAEKQAGAAAQKSASAEQEKNKDKVVVEHADKLRYDGDKKLYRLEGKVRIRHKDTVLTCDWAEYYEETDRAIARGHLLLKDPDTSVTGDAMSVDFTDEVAVVEGNVIIISQKKKKQEGERAGSGEAGKKQPAGAGEKTKPASASGKLAACQAAAGGASADKSEKTPTTIKGYRERKTTIYCSKVRYKYTEGQRYAWISGPIRAEQKDRTAWADRAEYDVEDGVLNLFGNVRVKTADGDEFQCPTAIISLDEEWLRAENVTGVAIRKKKKAGEEKETAPSAAAEEGTEPPKQKRSAKP